MRRMRIIGAPSWGMTEPHPGTPRYLEPVRNGGNPPGGFCRGCRDKGNAAGGDNRRPCRGKRRLCGKTWHARSRVRRTLTQDQLGVHRNSGRNKAVIPFVVVVQSNRFRQAARRVVVPLLAAEAFGLPDSDAGTPFPDRGSTRRSRLFADHECTAGRPWRARCLSARRRSPHLQRRGCSVKPSVALTAIGVGCHGVVGRTGPPIYATRTSIFAPRLFRRITRPN